MKVCCVCGARPNFMKIAAVIEALRPHAGIEPLLVHTGQHYDRRMSCVMFDDLRLPRPDLNLEVGSASHAVQTAQIMQRFEPVLHEHRPDLVVVVGDVNSTVACALVATKLGVPVAHVEAGLRSFDRSMPEEINRVMTDSVSDLLFVSEPSGVENLAAEGVNGRHVFFVGNVMIDTLLRHRDRAEASDVLERLGVEPGGYAALTLHRPSNVDDAAALGRIVDALEEVQSRLPVVFPVHPRTAGRLDEHGLAARMDAMPALHACEPMGYLEFLKVMAHARLVLTDSGGIQEETTALQVPCLTLRENTERPATIDSGFNRLVGSDPAAIAAAVADALAGPGTSGRLPERWDGRAGERVAEVLLRCANEGVPRR